MQYEIENNKIIKSKYWQKEFSSTIKQIVEFETTLIVLIDYDSNSNLIRNVFGIDKNTGIEKWQIAALDTIQYEDKVHVGIDKHYLEIFKVDNNTARLFNWDGTKFNINAENGALLENIIEARVQKRPW